jgi:serine/threonine protein kinase
MAEQPTPPPGESPATVPEVLNTPPTKSAAAPAIGEVEKLPRPSELLPPAPPTVRIPGYELIGELGRGGMGVVYLAEQTSLKRRVALKMILSGGHASAADRQRFRAEAEAIARLRHPQIVQVYEIGEADGQLYFSMEYVDGGSLSRRADCTPVEAARLVETLARAVHHAHQAGVVHRDLKPANVLLTDDGQPKITDFGIAKRTGGVTGMTQSGVILGTPGYMAPEQASGKTKTVGPAADVYALGAILYYLLTNRPPFQADSPFDTLLQVANDNPLSPRSLCPAVPRDLELICLKCLEKDSAHRYPSAEELVGDLRRFLAGEPVTAVIDGFTGSGWATRRGRPWLWLGLHLLFLPSMLWLAWRLNRAHDYFLQNAPVRQRQFFLPLLYLMIVAVLWLLYWLLPHRSSMSKVIWFGIMALIYIGAFMTGFILLKPWG